MSVCYVFVCWRRGVKRWRCPSPFLLFFIFFLSVCSFHFFSPSILRVLPLHNLSSFPLYYHPAFLSFLPSCPSIFPVISILSFCPPAFTFPPSLGDGSPRVPSLLVNEFFSSRKPKTELVSLTWELPSMHERMNDTNKLGGPSASVSLEETKRICWKKKRNEKEYKSCFTLFQCGTEDCLSMSREGREEWGKVEGKVFKEYCIIGFWLTGGM